MRVGVSWPGAHGRRTWISGGPLFWIAVGYPLLVVWSAVWLTVLVVVLTVRVVVLASIGAWWLASLPWHAKGHAH